MSFHVQARGTALFFQRVSTIAAKAEIVAELKQNLFFFCQYLCKMSSFYVGIASSFSNTVHDGWMSHRGVWYCIWATELCSIPVFSSRGEILHLFVPQLPHHLCNSSNTFLYTVFC